MDEGSSAFDPKNSFGQYLVRVVKNKNGDWFIDGSKSDFFDLTGVSWKHFLDMAKRMEIEKLEKFLCDNGFKLV